MSSSAAPETTSQATTSSTNGQGLSTLQNISLIAVFAALTAAFSLFPAISVGSVGVPITLQTLAVMLCGLILGGLRGGAAVALYVVVGLLGLPVFAKFNSGFGVLAGPTAGYLLSFPIAALVAGWLASVLLRRKKASFIFLFLAAMAGSVLIIHPMGIVGMMLNAGLDLGTAFGADIVFWPGDILKNLIAAGVAVAVFRAFPQLAQRRI